MEHHTFSHQPLNRYTDEIRLIHILPSDDSTTAIKCEIVHVGLSQNPQYEALSYMWGAEEESEHILIQGKRYGVRENLWLALKQLRLRDTTRCLWIDAICINQKDIAERNHQVDQMSLIFSQAERVIVWLGCSTKDSDDTLLFISQVDVEIEYYDYPKLGFLKHWKGLIRLCKRPYWTRLWIIQEVVLATRVVLRCGCLEVGWVQFITIHQKLHAARYFRELSIKTDTIPGRLSKLRVLDGAQSQSQSGKDPFLLDLLFGFDKSQCKDIRDRIFGLLSLAHKCCRDSVSADYSKTPFDVCQSTLRHHLQNHYPESDTAGIMKLVYRANSVFKEPSDFRQARIIYTTPLLTIISELSRHTPSKYPSIYRNQVVYLHSSRIYMGHSPPNNNKVNIGGKTKTISWIPSIEGAWQKLTVCDIRNYIHCLLCWFYGSPDGSSDPWPNCPKKDLGKLQIILDENGLIAITNIDVHLGARLYDKWVNKSHYRWVADEDFTKDLNHLFWPNKISHHNFSLSFYPTSQVDWATFHSIIGMRIYELRGRTDDWKISTRRRWQRRIRQKENKLERVMEKKQKETNLYDPACMQMT